MEPLGVRMNKVTVIPNGVDAKKFYRVEPAEAKNRLNLPKGRMILSVGGLVEGKGFHLIIRALKILIEKYHRQDAFHVLVGEGDMRAQIVALISSLGLTGKVILAGDTPHAELHRWYSAADVLCLASSREGWPNVLLEALACGTPIVATNVGGVPEIVRSENIGLLTRRTEEDIAQALQKALQTSWDHDLLVEYARQSTWDRSAMAVQDVLKTVLANKAKGVPYSGIDPAASPSFHASVPMIWSREKQD
jgi:glycosyltransferase involved in cell wall biosynthesis